MNKTIEVTKRDGTTETVEIRELTGRELNKWLEAVGDEGKLVELICGKPEGFADTLTLASYDEVISQGRELNEPYFYKWYQRMLERNERLSPGFSESLKRKAVSAMEGVQATATPAQS